MTTAVVITAGLLLFNIAPAVFGYRIGWQKKLPPIGFPLGFLFSWFGVLVMLLLPNRRPTRRNDPDPM